MNEIAKILKQIVEKKATDNRLRYAWVDGCKLVATDTRRLIVISGSEELGNGSLDVHAIHDAKPIDMVMGCNLVEGKYCDYSRIIPAEFMFEPIKLGDIYYEEDYIIFVNKVIRNMQKVEGYEYVNFKNLEIFKPIGTVGFHHIEFTQPKTGILFITGTINSAAGIFRFDFANMPMHGGK
jgi:hypothetical protein